MRQIYAIAALTATQGWSSATEHGLTAVFVWDYIKEAERYTKAASMKRLALNTMLLLVRRDEE